MHMPVNTDWFKETINAKKLTQRDVAEAIGVDPATLTLLFQGKRKMTLDRAKALSRAMGVSLHDVANNSGLEASDVDDRIDIIGTIDGEGVIHVQGDPIGTAICPEPPCDGSVAVMFRASAGIQAFQGFNGFLAFLGPQQELGSPVLLEVLDRLAVVKLKGRSDPLWRILRRGTDRDHYHLVWPGLEPLEDQEVEWVRQVQMIRPR